MKVIANKLNGKFFKDLFDNPPENLKELKIAVAYADKDTSKKLKDFCKKGNIKVEFYGRKKSENEIKYSRKPPIPISVLWQVRGLVVRDLHAKVFWFVEYGAYIGSANLTDSSWDKSIEFGIWFEHKELVDFNLIQELNTFFQRLRKFGEAVPEAA